MKLGKLERAARAWEMTAEPQVIMRAKRVFAQTHRSTARILLTDTVDVCRDLSWFLDRYPLTISAADLAYLEARAHQHVERESAIASMLAGGYTPRAFELAFPPREYQRFAADMALRTGGLLLADDVGLGKTVTAICTLTDPRTLPALVVTLTHLPRQWDAEIRRFAPTLRTHIVQSGKPYDLRTPVKKSRGAQLAIAGDLPDVVIINYHKLVGWAETLAGFIRSVVYDEVQELRHRKHGKDPSQRYVAAEMVSRAAAFRLGLSATPIYNYGGEMHAVLGVLRPDELGTSGEFRREWCSGEEEKARVKDPRVFGAYLRREGLMLRRTRADVGRELSSLSKIPHHVDADTSAIDGVAGAAAELARILLGTGESVRGEKWRAAEELSIRLRQATGIAKAPYVADFVRLLVESGEKVVLFGWHREVYDLWMQRLADLAPALYTGTESTTQKDAARERFVKGETSVLIMSLRSGAGLDGLQHVSRTVVFGELDWSPGVHEQCAGRVHRDGQKDPVAAYFMVADSGSDPIVADVLGVKAGQIEGLRDPNADLVEKLEVQEGHMKRLAEGFLRQRGLEVPEAERATG